MTRALSSLLLVLALAVPGGCQTPPPQQRLPDITFAHLEPLPLDVGSVETVSSYAAPFKRPNIEHLVPAPPEAALRRWAEERLRAAPEDAGAGERTAQLDILEASVTETELPGEGGLRGLLTREQSEKYTVTVAAELRILDARSRQLGFARARVVRTKTAREDITLNERERLWFDLVDQAMSEFDGQMVDAVRQHLGGYVSGR